MFMEGSRERACCRWSVQGRKLACRSVLRPRSLRAIERRIDYVCGICGVVGFGDLATLETMAETLAHRGPDAKGSLFLADESVGLGFRRLAVIDLSDEGNQPMGSADGFISLVFNGEIYNFSELRQELERSGRSFRSRTDTEV